MLGARGVSCGILLLLPLTNDTAETPRSPSLILFLLSSDLETLLKSLLGFMLLKLASSMNS